MIQVISQVQGEVIDSQDGQVKDSQVFDLAVDNATLAADIADYDPNSGTSPSVTVCRKYVRVLFDAYLARQGGG